MCTAVDVRRSFCDVLLSKLIINILHNSLRDSSHFVVSVIVFLLVFGFTRKILTPIKAAMF